MQRGDFSYNNCKYLTCLIISLFKVVIRKQAQHSFLYKSIQTSLPGDNTSEMTIQPLNASTVRNHNHVGFHDKRNVIKQPLNDSVISKNILCLP